MQNEIQPYEWGTRGREAFIPRLLGFEPEPGRPYAELWIGAHSKAPSKIMVNGGTVPLDQWIAAHPEEILGQAVVRRFGPRLPFLLKVLSAGEALSIQAHPDKTQAAALHARHPQHYPDDNHKPEIAVALEPLAALVGIKPLAGLLEALELYPELAGFIGQEAAGRLRSEYAAGEAEPSQLSRILFASLLRRSVTHAGELSEAIDHLAVRLRSRRGSFREPEALFLELREKYPGPDVGLFFLFLLNLVHLQEGQAIFTHAGVPHAYLKGNMIECMANSDNVVRVGLTPKFKDAETLVEIMDYEPRPAQIVRAGKEKASSLNEVRYSTPSDEFLVTRLRLGPGQEKRRATGGRISFLLLIKGHVQIAWDTAAKGDVGAERDAGDKGGKDELLPGQSVLLPAILKEYRLKASQPAEVFLAEVP